MLRKRIGFGVAVAALSLVAGALPAAATSEPTEPADGGWSHASGLIARGLVNLDLPHADSNGPQDGAVVDLGDVDLPLDAEVLKVSAVGGHSGARLAHVRVAELLEVSAIEVICKDGEGWANVADVQLPVGNPIVDLAGKPNTPLLAEPLGDLAQVWVDRRTENADGSLTVDGLVVKLLGDAQEIVVSSATCAPGDGSGDGDNPDDGGDDGDNPDDGGDNPDDGNDGEVPDDGNGDNPDDGDNGETPGDEVPDDGNGNDDGGDGTNPGGNDGTLPDAPAPSPVETNLPVTG